MASVYLHSLLLLSFLFSLSYSSPIFLPLTKHPQTHQHLTHFFNTKLVLDLNSPFLWITPHVFPNNNNTTAVLRRSIQCSAAGFHQSQPSDDRCTLSVKNPITGETGVGELVAVDDFLHVSVSAPSLLLSGLAHSAKGVIGLGRNRVGVVEQLSHTLGFSKKFSLCLSCSNNDNGMVLFGENRQIEVSKSMIYTPILMGNTNDGDSYHINLKSVKVQNKKLRLEEKLTSIQISTISPFTLMESKIYKAVINAFATEAGIMGMSRVNPVGRFELCYGMNESKKVPVIDLVLQSEMVKWRIYGHNSMVKVNDKVMCFGIFDGGDELKASIVLGTHQLEDHFIDFDLGTLMMGFTSSLGINQSSCSQLTSSMRKHVQSL